MGGGGRGGVRGNLVGRKKMATQMDEKSSGLRTEAWGSASGGAPVGERPLSTMKKVHKLGRTV